MRVIMMHRTNPRWEAGELPSQELIEGMGKLMGQMARAGVLLGGEGLRPSSIGVRLTVVGGRRTLSPGPFAGANELPAGFMIVQAAGLDEAVSWAARFASVVGDVEIDIRPVTEAWDLGVCPRPAGLGTTRFMLLYKADRRSEAGLPPEPEVQAGLMSLREQMQQAGVLLVDERLAPSSRGVRLRFSGEKRTTTDGPFTESKELIAGYCLLSVKSRDAALAWVPPFAALTGDVEVDVREVCEP